MPATVDVQLFNGSREPLGTTTNGMVTVRDPFDKNHTFNFTSEPVIVQEIDAITPQGNRNCGVIATAKGCSDGGFFPLALVDGRVNFVNLMLPPRKSAFNFDDAKWETLPEKNQVLRTLLETDQNAPVLYTELIKDQKRHRHLATLLNIVAAIECLPIPGILPLLKQIELSTNDGKENQARGLRQDRFFVWADKQLKTILSQNSTDDPANPAPMFDQEKNPGLLGIHKNADLSYKEIRFGEGNIQFTFLKNTAEDPPPDENWVKLELDMDYFRDAGSHAALEFIPNLVIGGLAKIFHRSHKTNAASMYALRWMAGKNLKDEKEFQPLYKLGSA